PDGHEITPHNGLLFIALGGGIFALFFFLAHWAKCLHGALRPSVSGPNTDSPYLLPLLVYAFLIMQAASTSFVSAPWELTVCACLYYRRRLKAPGLSPAVGRLAKRPPNRQFVSSKP